MTRAHAAPHGPDPAIARPAAETSATRTGARGRCGAKDLQAFERADITRGLTRPARPSRSGRILIRGSSVGRAGGC